MTIPYLTGPQFTADIIKVLNELIRSINSADPAPRTIVSTDTTYYVDPSSGSDANAGTQAAPFRTIRRAISQVCDYIFIDNGVVVTIQLAAGTYAEYVLLRDYLSTDGTNSGDFGVTLAGDITNPGAYVIKPSGSAASNGFRVLFDNAKSPWIVRGVTIDGTNTSSAFVLIGCEGGGLLQLQDFKIVCPPGPGYPGNVWPGRFYIVRLGGFIRIQNNYQSAIDVVGTHAQAIADTYAGEIQDETVLNFLSAFTVDFWLNLSFGRYTINSGAAVYTGGPVTVTKMMANDFYADVLVTSAGTTIIPGTPAVGDLDYSCRYNGQISAMQLSGMPSATPGANFLYPGSYSWARDSGTGFINLYYNDAGTIKALGSPGGTGVVANLPAPGIPGRRGFVNNANSTVFGSIVAAGGANSVPVYDDGTNWRIG